MSAPVTETSTFTATVQVPLDGDPATAASVIQHVQPVTNRTRYLFDQLTLVSAYISAFLAFISNSKAIREIKSVGYGVASESAPPQWGGGTPSGVWTDIGGATIAFASGPSGDELYAEFNAPFNTAFGTPGDTVMVRLTAQSTTQTQTVFAQDVTTVFNAVQNCQIKISGKHVMAYAEAYTIKAQMKCTGTGMGLDPGWFMKAERIDLTP